MVAIRYFKDRSGGSLGSFGADFRSAHRASARPAKVRTLVLDHLHVDLGRKTDRAMDRYLETRQIWKSHGVWKVIKTSETPCIAYTAHADPAGAITIEALGVCDTYPGGSAETWWANLIRPRVESL